MNRPRPIRRLIVGTCVAGVLALLLYQLGLFAMVIWFNFRDPAHTRVMQETLHALRAEDPEATLAYQWTPYDQIATSLKRAVIASEDSGFTAHNGIEWEAIRAAWEYNQRQAAQGRDRRRGGSTITQQVAKNLFLSNRRSYLRKAQELVLTYMIEAVMDKTRILELYLNIAQWGRDVFGAQAAARHYYRTDASRLSNAQAARLAAMLPNPAFYDANGATRYLRGRSATIQARMRQVDIP